MTIRKYFVLTATAIALSLSGAAIAKQPNGHKGHHESSPSDSSLLNSNKQSDEESLRGADRADERHELNESREPSNVQNANKPEKHKSKKH
jgi:hypothetical protein